MKSCLLSLLAFLQFSQLVSASQSNAAACRDSPSTGFTSMDGVAMTCAQLAPYCSHSQYGSTITQKCPQSCGACDVSVCQDAMTTGFLSNGVTMTCAELVPYCDDFRYGTQITLKCPLSCGTCAPVSVCQDSASTGIVSQRTGVEYTCKQLASYCTDFRFGALITTSCPLTCGACPPTGQAASGTTRSWENVGDAPYAAHHAFAFALNGYGYMVAGQTPNGPTDNFVRYDPQSNEWSSLGVFPGGARNYGIGDVEDGVAFFGFGTNRFNRLQKDLWSFDGNTWTKVTDCDCQARTHPAMVVIGKKVYVGAGGGLLQNLNDFWVYDMLTDRWTELTPINGPIRHHPYQFKALDVDGTMKPMVLFGHGPNGIFDTTHQYDPNTNTWTMMNKLPAQGRVAGTQFSYNGAGYALSGEGEDHRSMDTGEFWRFELGEWSSLTPHPGRSRWAPASFILDGYVYILGGQIRQDVPPFSEWPLETYRFYL